MILTLTTVKYINIITTIVHHHQCRRHHSQPGERPGTTCSADISSTQQHSIMLHATEEAEE